MPKKVTLLQWALELERRQAAQKQQTKAEFIARCRDAQPEENAPIETGLRALTEVKKIAGTKNVHAVLVDLIEEIDDAGEV